MNHEWMAQVHYNVDKRNSVYMSHLRCDAIQCDAIFQTNKNAFNQLTWPAIQSETQHHQLRTTPSAQHSTPARPCLQMH
jgi:hypothetical protein